MPYREEKRGGEETVGGVIVTQIHRMENNKKHVSCDFFFQVFIVRSKLIIRASCVLVVEKTLAVKRDTDQIDHMDHSRLII